MMIQHSSTSVQASYLVLFDGVCNLCNHSVQFIIRHDPNEKFVFASLQSSFAQEILARSSIAHQPFDSVVLYKNEQLYTKSEAALFIAAELTGGWRYLRFLRLVPLKWRNWIYDQIAQRRYRFFGKKESCMLPSPELKRRFLG